MLFFTDLSKQMQATANKDLTSFGLKAAIIFLAILFIFLAIVVDDKLALAAIFAYMILP